MTALGRLSRGEADRELQSLNELCGDTWCEGSFDLYFHGISCAGRTCTLAMRWYGHTRVAPPPDVSTIDVRGSGYHGWVTGVGTFAKCTPPCWSKGDLAPCSTFDVGCEVDAPPGKPAGEVSDAALSACIDALEKAIRARAPE